MANADHAALAASFAWWCGTLSMVSQFQIENSPMPGGKSGPKSRFCSHGAIRQGWHLFHRYLRQTMSPEMCLASHSKEGTPGFSDVFLNRCLHWEITPPPDPKALSLILCFHSRLILSLHNSNFASFSSKNSTLAPITSGDIIMNETNLEVTQLCLQSSVPSIHKFYILWVGWDCIGYCTSGMKKIVLPK